MVQTFPDFPIAAPNTFGEDLKTYLATGAGSVEDRIEALESEGLGSIGAVADVADGIFFNGTSWENAPSVFHVRMSYDDLAAAAGDGATDDTAAFQRTIEAAGARPGGGTVCVCDGEYLINTQQYNTGGVAGALLVVHDNVHIRLESGAVIRATTLTDGATLFLVYGPSKPEGHASWTSHTYQQAEAPILIALDDAAPFEKGTYTVTTATAADAGNFATGDILYIRTGQTINFPSLPYQPWAEPVEVLSANASTGVITLKQALSQTYQQHYYVDEAASIALSGPTITTDTGWPAPYGIVNATAGYVRNFRLTGDGYIETQNISTILNCEQVFGIVLKDYTFSTGKHHAFGNNVRFTLMDNVRGISTFEDGVDATGNGAFCWAVGWGTGSCDGVFRDVTMHAPRSSVQCHFHEGVGNFELRNVQAIGAPGRTTTNCANLSILGQAHDIRVYGGMFANCGGSSRIITLSSTSFNVLLDGVAISGAQGNGGTEGLYIQGTGHTVRNLDLRDGLRWFCGSDVLIEPKLPHLPSSVFTAVGGSPLPTQVVTGNFPTWSLPDTTDSFIGTMTTLPAGAPSLAKLRIYFISPSATGDVRFHVRVSWVGVNESIAQLQLSTLVTGTAAAASTLYSTAVAAFALPPSGAALGDQVLVRIGRDGSNVSGLDNLAGAIGVIAVAFEPSL